MTVTSSDVVFALGGTGDTALYVDATSGTSESSSLNWTIQASDDAGGASPTACSGSLGTSISGSAPDTTAPNISDIVVSDVTQTSVKITWTTDENSNSSVDYGTTDDYGSTKSDSTSTTSHSITIDSLSANTTYHFNVKSTDSSSNQAEAGDNTFVSSKASTTSTTTVTTTTTQTVSDTTLPAVLLSTDFKKVYSEAPTIIGKATDDSGISLVEYSIDGGRNWLSAKFDKIGAKSTNFTFTPYIIDDGNYDIKVRATDPSGNKTVSKTYTLVIDRLPPRVGGVLFSLGPLAFLPDENGNVSTIEGLDTNVTLSGVGGPITLELITNAKSQMLKDSFENQAISLTKNIETGLWSGNINLPGKGTFDLTTRSIDGANNVTEEEIGNVIALPPGKVTSGERGVIDAKVKVFVYQPQLSGFVLWDAAAYGQVNPQKADIMGRYKLILPGGRYYLEISAPGFFRARSAIFEIDHPTPITQDFNLDRKVGIYIGKLFIGLPDFRTRVVELEADRSEVGERSTNSEGKTMPDFSLQGENTSISNLSLLGRTTILTLISTWMPDANDEIMELEKIKDEYKELNVYIVAEGESRTKIDTFSKLGGYKVDFVADPDGILIGPLGVRYFPSHVFVDRKGVVDKVVVGFLTKEEIVENLLD